MVRKILHIAMALLLMVSITGFTLHKHYCGDELTGLALYMDANDCSENSCSHCEDVTVSCRLDVDLLSANAQNIPEKTQTEITEIELLSTGTLTVPKPVQSTSVIVRLIDHSSLHGIPMLQSFLC